MLLGVVWSGILAYGAAVFLIKPLRKLEEAARKAAEGDIREDVPLPKTDWETSTWIYTALGDTYFLNREYEKAKSNLYNALNW